MEQSPSWAANRFSVKEFPTFYGTHSYVPASCPYPEPDQSRLYPHVKLLEDFYIHGSVHRESDLITVQQYVTVCS